MLQFRRWLSLAALDTVTLKVNGATVWSTNAANQDTGWTLVQYDVSSILDSATTATIRFELATNANNVAGGWAIDDVELLQFSDAAPPLLYGNATAGTGNVQPAISMSAPAALGTTTTIQGSSMLGSAPAILAINLADTLQNVNGIEVLVQPAGAAVLFTLTDGSGFANWPFAVPTSVAFDNLYLYSQAFVLDAGSANGQAAATVGMRYRVCRR